MLSHSNRGFIIAWKRVSSIELVIIIHLKLCCLISAAALQCLYLSCSLFLSLFISPSLFSSLGLACCVIHSLLIVFLFLLTFCITVLEAYLCYQKSHKGQRSSRRRRRGRGVKEITKKILFDVGTTISLFVSIYSCAVNQDCRQIHYYYHYHLTQVPSKSCRENDVSREKHTYTGKLCMFVHANKTKSISATSPPPQNALNN